MTVTPNMCRNPQKLNRQITVTMAMKSDLTTWQMLHTTPQRAINEALQEQAGHLKGNSWVMLTDSKTVALTGNLLLPQYLWLFATPDEDVSFTDGLNVAIHPSSEHYKQLWEKKGCGKVLSVIPDPLILVDSVIRTATIKKAGKAE